ncbi:unnamed protein product, partial [Protopolystoma xenopodis]
MNCTMSRQQPPWLQDAQLKELVECPDDANSEVQANNHWKRIRQMNPL